MFSDSIDLIRQTIEKYARPVAYVILAALVLFVFAQVVNFDFINIDDDLYVFGNRYIQNGLTLSGLDWALRADLLFDSINADYWQPITFISRMLDFQLFGMHPGMHHLVNVVYHLANTFLLFQILFSFTKAFWKSIVVAAIFAIHPLQVEAVAWVTARKDVLGCLFAFLTILLYADHRKSGSRKSSIFAVITFACSLMAKPIFVTLPIIFCFLDYWPLEKNISKKTEFKNNLIQKWPFFILSAIFCAIPFIGQPRAWNYASPEQIAAIWIDNIFLYILQILYPKWLSIIRTRFEFDEPVALILASIAVLGNITWRAIQKRKEKPAFFVGWFWFLISIFPLAPVNPMANRFTYFPLIGFALAFVWEFDNAVMNAKSSKFIRGLFFIVLILFYSLKSFAHVGVWKNNETFFHYALSEDPDNYLAHLNLGKALEDTQGLEQAIERYERALKIYPKYPNAQSNLAILYLKTGQMEKGLNHLNPGVQKATRAVHETDMAIDAEFRGDIDQALEHAKEAVRYIPENAVANRIAGVALMKKDQNEEALKYLEAAVNSWAEFSEGLNALAYYYGKKKDYNKAVEYCKKAIKARSTFSDPYNNMGVMLEKLGKPREALEAYQKAIILDPKSKDAKSNFEGLSKELGVS